MSGLLADAAPGRMLSPDPHEIRALEQVTAFVAVALLSSRIDLHPMLPLGYVVALAGLPVTLAAARRYRGALIITSLSTLAMAGGLALTWVNSPEAWATTATTVGQALRILMIGAGAMLLLWARTVLGTRPVVLSYALGWFVSLALTGLNPLNIWKFSLAVPVVMLVLSLPLVFERAWIEMAALLGLGLVSATQDSRSAAAQMLIAGALVISGRGRESRRGRTVFVLVRLALLGVGGFLLVQAALLRGDLGEEARQRTMEQIDTSGSVLLGGRPEVGATLALLQNQPWGYGIGSQPSPSEVGVAKTGMAELGYDPDNGYVERFMFGDGFEVHSVVGNLWLLSGIPGLLLALTTAGFVVWGMAQQLGRRMASGVMLFLAVRFVWDFAFSPISSSLPLLMLCVALTLPERAPPPAPVRSPAVGEGPGPHATVHPR